jgi:hypothetical protein
VIGLRIFKRKQGSEYMNRNKLSRLPGPFASVQNVPDENHHRHKHSKTNENKKKHPALRHRNSLPAVVAP